jgi:hypothetical protein
MEGIMTTSQPTTASAASTNTHVHVIQVDIPNILPTVELSNTSQLLISLADKVHYVAIGIFTIAAFVCAPILTLLSIGGGYWAQGKRFQILPQETIIDPEKQLFATPEKRLITLAISVFVLPLLSSPLSIISLGFITGRYIKVFQDSFSQESTTTAPPNFPAQREPARA